MRSSLLLLASLAASLGVGCTIQQHKASMQDDLGLRIDLGNDNALSSPYVAGSQFHINLFAGDGATNDGWTLSSSDPGVMQVGAAQPGSQGAFAVQAVAPGHATLTVKDKGGNVIDTADVDVAVPTRIQLCEQGLIYAGYSDDQAALTSVQVIDGGTATFLARYFDGTQELNGNNVLTAGKDDVVGTQVVSTSFSASDFIQITGTSTGSTTLHLAAGGASLDMPVTVVDPSVVTSVKLAQQSESGAKDGTTLFVFARAFDASGAGVYGGSFSWTLDASPLPGSAGPNDPSDLMSYQYQGSSWENAMATLNGDTASTIVHGKPSTTSVGSSANVGCSVARGAGSAGSGAAGGLVFVGLAFLASRRRRTS